MTRLAFILLAIPLALVPVYVALSEGGSARVGQVDATAFPQIDVYVSVLDAAGAPIPNLRQDDFKLFENGREVPFTLIGSGANVSVALVIDQSGSMAGAQKLSSAQQAALAFLAHLKPADQAAIIAFSDSVRVLQPLGRDNEAAAAQVKALTPTGNTALFDATSKALEILKPVRGRKAAVVLTDGMNNAGRSSIDDVIKQATADTTSIFTIGLGRRSWLPGTGDIDEGVLQRLASATSGEYYYAPDASGLSQLYLRIARQLGSEYLLRYQTPRPQTDGTKRSVQVRVRPTGSEDLVANGSYLVGGVLGAGGVNWPAFVGMLVILLALLHPAGMPAVLEGKRKIARRRPQVSQGAIRSARSDPAEVNITGFPFFITAGGTGLRFSEEAQGNGIVKCELYGGRLVLTTLNPQAKVLVSYTGQDQHWRSVPTSSAIQEGSKVSINGVVFEVRSAPWRLIRRQ